MTVILPKLSHGEKFPPNYREREMYEVIEINQEKSIAKERAEILYTIYNVIISICHYNFKISTQSKIALTLMKRHSAFKS